MSVPLAASTESLHIRMVSHCRALQCAERHYTVFKYPLK